MPHTLRLPAALALLLALVASPALGDNSAGITVVGSGSAATKPTTVAILAKVQSEAPVAADAVVKFRDAKRRAIEAMTATQTPGVRVTGSGFTIDSTITQQQMQMIWQGQAPPQIDAQVRVSEQLTITLSEIAELDEAALIERIMQVLDTAKEAGLVTGAALATQNRTVNWGQRVDTSLATFSIDDPDALKTKAYETAIADARAQAQRLAQLAGVTLGPVQAITEIGSAEAETQISAMYFYNYAQQQSGEAENSTPRFEDVAVQVNLKVRFAIGEE